MNPISFCLKPDCGHVIFRYEVHTCPKCGGPMGVRRKSRPVGWAMLIVGWPLALAAGGTAVLLLQALLDPAVEEGRTIPGSVREGWVFLPQFAVLALIGLMLTYYGIERVATGRARRLMKFYGFLAIVIFWAVSLLYKPTG